MYTLIIVAGRLISKPIKELDQEGNPLVFMTILDEQKRRDKNTGELRSITRQYEVKAFGHEALSCIKNLEVGHRIIAEGRPSLRTWNDADGKAKGVIVCNTDHVRFIDKGKKVEDASQPGNSEE